MTPHEKLNKMIFGSAGTSSLVDVQMRIQQMQRQLAEELAKFEELRTKGSKFVTEETVGSFCAKTGKTGLVPTETGISVVFDAHPTGWLIGPKQRESRNNGILFCGNPIYRTRVDISDLRGVTILNESSESVRAYLCTNTKRGTIESYIRNRFVSDITAKMSGALVPYFMSDGSGGVDICHPHATGRPDRFGSVCFGNNKWAAEMPAVRTAGDFMALLYRAHLWVTTANLHDMYSNYMWKVVKMRYQEGNCTSAHKTLLVRFMQHILKHVYAPLYEHYVANGESAGFLSAEADLPSELTSAILRKMLPNLTEDTEYIKLLQDCADNSWAAISLDSDMNNKTQVMHPMFFPVFTLMHSLSHAYDNRVANLNTGALIQRINAVYAAYLLAHKGIIPYERTTMYNDMRYTILACMNTSMPGYVGERMLLSPLALKDTGSHAPAYLDYTK